MLKPCLIALMLAWSGAPVLAATYHVSPAGRDENLGTAVAPWRTLRRAATDLQPGDTVLIEPGTYRETVELTRSGTRERPIVFKARRPGTVVVTGADPLENWVRVPGSRPLYATAWPHDFIIGTGGDGMPVRHHMAAPPTGNAEQVIWNERPLPQVMHNDQLRPGTFYVDWQRDRLFLYLPGGADPDRSRILGSTRAYLFGPRNQSNQFADVRYIKVQGLTFRYAANFPQRAMVRGGLGWRFEDSTVEWANANGLDAGGDDVVLLRVTAQYNGLAGLGGYKLKNLLIKDSLQRGNNWKGFEPSNEASTKFVACDRVHIQNMISYGNTGPGLWFDWDNTNIVIEDSTVYGNRGLHAGWEGIGIFIEASPGPVTLRNNVVYSNTGAGIGLAESENVLVLNNTLVDNGVNLELRAMEGRENHKLAGVIVRGNRFKDAREAMVKTSLGTWSTNSPQEKRIQLDGNLYDARPERGLFFWAGRNLSGLEAVRSALGLERRGARGTVPFERKLVASRTIDERRELTIDRALSRGREGSTVTIPVNGRSGMIRTANGWTVEVYDLANTSVRLLLPDEKLRSAVERRITPFPFTEPVLLEVKLTRRTPDLEAVAVAVGQ